MKRSMRLLRVTAYAVVCVCQALPAEEFRVELTVREDAGIDRQREPISGGVPLPAGRFARRQEFVLERADGSEVPCQVSPLVVETDGTLRWILVDLIDDLGAAEVRRYVLRPGTPRARPAASLQVDATESAVTVDTGEMRVAVSRTRPFALFDRVETGDRAIAGAGGARYEQLAGRKGWNDKASWQKHAFVAAPPDVVRVVRSGPLRVTLEVRGQFIRDPLRAAYRAWLTAWAGSSRVLVKYAFANSNPDRYTVIPVASSSIELRLSQPSPTILGAQRPVAAQGDAWIHQGLLLHDRYRDVPSAWRAGVGDKTLATGGGPKERPEGWIVAGGVFVCDRLFSAQPPRRLSFADGVLRLEGIAPKFRGEPTGSANDVRRRGEPFAADAFWLYDSSRHSSEYLFDFDPPVDPRELSTLARASRQRLWIRASADYLSDCEVVGVGRFGTLDDELESYRRWGWTHREQQLPSAREPQPHAFVAREDNHYESEADSVEGLVLMYLRTGQRGFFDQAEAWARYHMDLQTWRTDGWAWKDGGIWFPSGGPQGNRRVREDWNFAWGASWGDRQRDPDCTDLWIHARSKSCYCHFYGCGLADWYCLTGDTDALDAALDNVEQKDDEFRHFRQLEPGRSTIGSIRGFGRGFEVATRVLQAKPRSELTRSLCELCARVLWQSPLLDERGFHAAKIGGGWGGMAAKEITPRVKAWMDQNGMRWTGEGGTVDSIHVGDRSWKVTCFGGTWQHGYLQRGAELYAQHFDDEDLRDFTIAFGQFSARYLLSEKCHQAPYYAFLDVTERGRIFDPWAFEHTDTKDGEGCVHSGWYTRFFPDVCARAYSLTGEAALLEQAKSFWYYGSKRGYRTKGLAGGPDEVGRFAGHTPPKDDTVLEVCRLFRATARGRDDRRPPRPVTDLRVERARDGSVQVQFTAPADDGGGAVARYQVKAAALPIASYGDWDPVADPGRRRNWWKAANGRGEPVPSAPATLERFAVRGIPIGERVWFAVRSFDAAGNRSAIGSVVAAGGAAPKGP